MTQEVIDQLTKEKKDVQIQLDQYVQALNVLKSQLDANKQMLSQSMNSEFQVRSDLIMTQRQVQELSNKNAELNTSVTSLNQQLTDATVRLNELDAPKLDNVEPIQKVDKKGR